MPPETEEQIAAEQATMSKLTAFFEAEQKAEPVADTSIPEPAAEQEEPSLDIPADDDRPRNEKGQFVKAEEKLYAGKYKSADDLERAYSELESRLGSQGQELGELRRQFEESLEARLGQFQETQQQHQYASQAPTVAEQMLERGDYYQAAELARQANNGALYGHVMEQWAVESPFQAMNYHTYQVQQAQQAQTVQLLDERLAPVNTLAERSASQDQHNRLLAAFDEFAKDKPDINVVGTEMLKVAEESPDIVAVIQGNNPKATEQVLRFLYREARDRVSDTLAQASQRADAETHEEARLAKQQATVGNNTQAASVAPNRKPDPLLDGLRNLIANDPLNP